MGDWTEQDKPALQQMCRDRELPVSGTKQELIARLAAWELREVAKQPLGDPDSPIEPDDPDGLRVQLEPELAEWARDNGTIQVSGWSGSGFDNVDESWDGDDDEDDDEAPGAGMDASSAPGYHNPRGSYRHHIPVEGTEISDQDHMQYLEQTHQAARELGYRTRGAPHAGHRIGFVTGEDGQLNAIYEISART